MGYTLRGKKGVIQYVGVTNNPKRRAAEHRRAGKVGTLKIETRKPTRAAAHNWERRKLASYRTYHAGKNPSQNKTRNGNWRF